MTGLNHVQPGGAPIVVRLSPTVTMTKISVGPMDNNAYLLQTGSGATVLIDAANNSGRLLKLIGDEPLDSVVTTHRHGDHWQALAAVAEATGARLVGGRPDVDAIAEGAKVSGLVGVWDGDQVELGEESLAVIGLVGHTPGSITLAYRGGGPVHLFTGDSLFPGGPGRTTNPKDFASLMADLESKVFGRFDDEAVVHPGHGDDTTLGVERPHLAEWRARGW
ncbi:MAG TPA: MBL fold metallo-hydrolase [Propionibacteriaceae bacterium]|nr:MBL fold metallo-hydrolase [Propionibacteriaceae bacterium]